MFENEVKNHLKGAYAVFGNPIVQSKSPQLHQAFAQQFGKTISYTKQLVGLDGFDSAASDFFVSNGMGLNITAPFKGNAHAFAHKLTNRASMADAVNTLAMQADGSILGDNTDGPGLVWDIVERLGWELEGKHVLVLGAGGAVRGVVYSLLQKNPKSLTIANRSVDKAKLLEEKFAPIGPVMASTFTDLLEMPLPDLIINGTSAGLHNDVPNVPANIIRPDACVYDMVYSDTPTAFIQWAREHGAIHTSDGLGMLVGQAGESFYLWHGLRPDTESVVSALKRH